MVRLLAIAMSLILLFGLVHFLSAWIVRQYQQAQEAAEREAAALRSFARLGLAINVVSHDMPGFTGELRNSLHENRQDIRQFDLVELLHSVTTALRTGLDLELTVCSVPPKLVVSGSPSPWIQMIENIIRNAFESSETAPSISVRLLADAEDINLEIANDGPPIPTCAA